MLDSVNCCEHGIELFCKKCYGRVHGPKGVGWGIGAGVLSMDAGEHFGNTEAVSNRNLTAEAFCAPGLDTAPRQPQQQYQQPIVIEAPAPAAVSPPQNVSPATRPGTIRGKK